MLEQSCPHPPSPAGERNQLQRVPTDQVDSPIVPDEHDVNDYSRQTNPDMILGERIPTNSSRDLDNGDVKIKPSHREWEDNIVMYVAHQFSMTRF